MSPKDFRDALESVGIAPRDASRFFQTDERTTRRWAADDGGKDVPRAVAITLRLMQRFGLSPADVVALMNDEDDKRAAAETPTTQC